ncbi:hypothetical protein ACFRNT_00690 [Streptomyces sp. NPDC056697]|uniref:hypothetical protein n=1 Tax=Streptomyces sp. NPDC056697 TaxID=3345915 RepID=UPI003687980E
MIVDEHDAHAARHGGIVGPSISGPGRTGRGTATGRARAARAICRAWAVRAACHTRAARAA